MTDLERNQLWKTIEEFENLTFFAALKKLFLSF